MTDRHKGYVVTLADDIREDDAEAVVNALRMVRGVIGVEPVVAGLIDDQMIRTRVDQQWRSSLIQLVQHGPGEQHG